MQDKLLEALKRAISGLNMLPSFRTAEGIKSYELLAELDAPCEKSRDDPQIHTEAMRRTSGPAVDGADNGVDPVNSRGHLPATSASGTKSHFWIFDLCDVSGRDFPILRRGKGSKATGRDPPIAFM